MIFGLTRAGHRSLMRERRALKFYRWNTDLDRVEMWFHSHGGQWMGSHVIKVRHLSLLEQAPHVFRVVEYADTWAEPCE